MKPAAPMAIPVDVRLMNALASVLFVVAGLLVLGALLSWLARLPMFAIAGVTVTGDMSHYNAITLRANVMPRLHGTFFTLDVAETRDVFQTMPWVRHAVVQRDFPNRLKVRLEEHQAVAYWGAEGDDERLVNTYGEVFEANMGELERDNLPRLQGPEGQSARVLDMHRTLQPLFAPMELGLAGLELTPQGAWVVRLDSGTEIALGRGSTPELTGRLQRFLKTITQVTARYQRRPDQLASVDLRHTDGYAIRLDGVATFSAEEFKNAKASQQVKQWQKSTRM